MPRGKNQASLVSFGTFCFVCGMVISKWVAFASLFYIRSSLLAVWIAAEFVLLLVLRQVLEGSWRFHGGGLDGALTSLLVHICIYIGSVAAA